MASTPPPSSSARLGQVLPGLHVDWILDNTILVFTVRDLSRQAVDVWVDILKDMLSTWDHDQPFLSLYDMNFPEATLTPYMRQRIGSVLNNSQNLYGRTALVMQRSFLVNLAKLFLRGEGPGMRQRKLFHSRDKALDWLKASAHH